MSFERRGRAAHFWMVSGLEMGSNGIGGGGTTVVVPLLLLPVIVNVSSHCVDGVSSLLFIVPSHSLAQTAHNPVLHGDTQFCAVVVGRSYVTAKLDFGHPALPPIIEFRRPVYANCMYTLYV